MDSSSDAAYLEFLKNPPRFNDNLLMIYACNISVPSNIYEKFVEIEMQTLQKVIKTTWVAPIQGVPVNCRTYYTPRQSIFYKYFQMKYLGILKLMLEYGTDDYDCIHDPASGYTFLECLIGPQFPYHSDLIPLLEFIRFKRPDIMKRIHTYKHFHMAFCTRTLKYLNRFTDEIVAEAVTWGHYAREEDLLYIVSEGYGPSMSKAMQALIKLYDDDDDEKNDIQFKHLQYVHTELEKLLMNKSLPSAPGPAPALVASGGAGGTGVMGGYSSHP